MVTYISWSSDFAFLSSIEMQWFCFLIVLQKYLLKCYGTRWGPVTALNYFDMCFRPLNNCNIILLWQLISTPFQCPPGRASHILIMKLYEMNPECSCMYGSNVEVVIPQRGLAIAVIVVKKNKRELSMQCKPHQQSLPLTLSISFFFVNKTCQNRKISEFCVLGWYALILSVFVKNIQRKTQTRGKLLIRKYCGSGNIGKKK